jgi:hypothetical protein
MIHNVFCMYIMHKPITIPELLNLPFKILVK